MVRQKEQDLVCKYDHGLWDKSVSDSGSMALMMQQQRPRDISWSVYVVATACFKLIDHLPAALQSASMDGGSALLACCAPFTTF